jgi:uncharacterized protein (TIGR02145 family)
MKKNFLLFIGLIISFISYSQTWSNENLNVSKFKNGDKIEEASSDTAWIRLCKNKIPGWCYYENKELNGSKFGKLYNFFAVNDPRGLAPEGFYIPTDLEFTKFTNQFSDTVKIPVTLKDSLVFDLLGSKLKSVTGWKNKENSNVSNFNGLPGGYRLSNGTFENIGNYGYWWTSSTDYVNGLAYYRYLMSDYNFLGRESSSNKMGFSVRCMKN